MKRFNYRAISLIPGLVKLIERDRPRSLRGRRVLRMQLMPEPWYLGHTSLPGTCPGAQQTWTPGGTAALTPAAQGPVNRSRSEEESIQAGPGFSNQLVGCYSYGELRPTEGN